MRSDKRMRDGLLHHSGVLAFNRHQFARRAAGLINVDGLDLVDPVFLVSGVELLVGSCHIDELRIAPTTR